MTRPTVEQLRAALLYDPVSGGFWWKWRDNVPKEWNSRWAGKPALTTYGSNGYLYGKIFNKDIKAHRAAFAIWNGYFVAEVDHRNGVLDDNRSINLRPSNAAHNAKNRSRQANNSSGVTGVNWHKSAGKWRAQIRVNRRDIHLGHFSSLDAAAAARKAAEIKHGFDPLHGRSEAVRANRRLIK